MKELKIDQEFKSLIPPLTDDEYKRLEENIKVDGCRDSLVTWNGIIVDGHNRYRICKENNIEFKAEEIKFKNREEVIIWMLQNQLGRRNLNDFQRNEIALKFQNVIAQQMKEKQKAAASKGGKSYSPTKGKTNWSEPSNTEEPTNQRKEMAKIAGTSEGSVQRTKLILEKGTPEQIERARKGGKGNTVSSIADEIKKNEHPEEPTKICSKCRKELPVSAFYKIKRTGKPESQCKECKNSAWRPKDFMSVHRAACGEQHEASSIFDNMTEEEFIGDLYDVNKVIVHTIDDLIRDFTVNFDSCIDNLRWIIEKDKDLLKDKENNKKMADILSQAVAAMDEMKGDYINDNK